MQVIHYWWFMRTRDQSWYMTFFWSKYKIHFFLRYQDIRILIRFCDWTFLKLSTPDYLTWKPSGEKRRGIYFLGFVQSFERDKWTKVRCIAYSRIAENSQWGFRFPPWSWVSCIPAFFLFALSSSDVFVHSSVAKAFMQIAVSLFAEKCLPSRSCNVPRLVIVVPTI